MTTSASRHGECRLGIDIGGTFTDVVLEDVRGRMHTTKVLTTPRAPEQGVMAGVDEVLRASGVSPGDVALVIHGTTLVTNALIERRGAVTALITTHGHRDALEIGTESRFAQYDIFMTKPEPLVPRQRRFTVRERVLSDGSIAVPLAMDEVEAIVPRLAQAQVAAVAVGLLHGYANPAHERAIGERLARRLPGVQISLSSEVSGELREYERFSTTCANAYVQPMMARYLGLLEQQLQARGLSCPLFLMLSGGGLCAVETAARFPIRLAESGPAGGAMFASHLARSHDLARVLSFDMGGTTAKICLIDDGKPQGTRSFETARVYRFMKGSGLPLRIPAVDMVEIGAGGGSIAHLDKMGRIAVGPESAGAEPGPASYGRGGARPTVTDADLAMGRIAPARFAAGTLPLDPSKARTALMSAVGEPLGLSLETASFGVAEMVDENMASAARVHAIESGKGFAGRAMIAFGGAAPLHAARVAEKLGIDTIVIPAHAGVGSAVGFLRSPVAYEVVRSNYQRLSALAADELNALFDAMTAEAAVVVARAAPGRATTSKRTGYMRYVGQAHEIEVEIPLGRYAESDGVTLRGLFEAAYRRLFNRLVPGVEVEAMSWKVDVATELPAPEPPPGGATSRRAEPVEHRALFEPAAGRFIDAAVYRREALPPGALVSGPAVIEEDETSTVLTGAFDAVIHDWAIVLTRRAGDSG
ncbi:MAG: hydantoinase/oxoprolinase family protein [Alphaproteobacteria bacterium]|nr:hydantoinase/oxoprolinase family protein [Alphaproteobacteria bacterium]